MFVAGIVTDDRDIEPVARFPEQDATDRLIANAAQLADNAVARRLGRCDTAARIGATIVDTIDKPLLLPCHTGNAGRQGAGNTKVRRCADADAVTDTVIDLEDELVALLPLLVAAYVWADDEPAKCEYYLSLYREQEAQIKSAIKNIEPVTVTTNGW